MSQVTEQQIWGLMTQPAFFKGLLPVREDEYFDVDDQNIKCKKCNTRRTRGGLKNNEKRVRFLCKCQSIAVQQRDALRNEDCTRQKLKALKDNSLLGELYRNARFETSDYNRDESYIKASNFCSKYCDYPLDAIKQNYGLYIYGESGLGKTHLMACMINKLTDNFYSCYITNFAEIQKTILDTFNSKSKKESDYIEELMSADFLFIDDFGVQRLFKQGEDTWLQEKIYDVINKRYNQNKPIIFSSNYSKADLARFKSIEGRTLDRINEMTKKDIKIIGDSYRKIQRRNAKLPFEE